MASFVLYELLPVILNMSLTAGVVILCVLLARLCMKKAPKVFSYALWAVVLFRLLCPVSVNAEFSLLGLLRSPAVEATEHTTVIEYVPQTVVVTPPAPQTQTQTQVQLPPSATTPAVPPTGGVTTIPSAGSANNTELSNTPQAEGPAAQTGDPAMAVATFAWLGGVAVMAAYSVISYNRLKSRLVGAVRLRENIYLADHIGSPFVMGIIRPKIYLPSSLPEQEQRYILLHEQHHIRRGDHLIKALAFVALCIHWFNPLVWLAFILSGKDMEMSCDEAVVKKLGEEIRSDYSASLLSLATGRRVIAGTPLAFGEGDTKSRIKNMLNWKRAKPAVVFLSAAAVILVLLVCVTNPKTDEPADEETQAEQKLAEHDIPKEVSKVLLDFLDAYQNDPEKASSFCHFETEEEKTAFEKAVLINRIVSYEILDADARSEDLYEIKFHLIKESGDIPERSYYVGKHNGQFWVMINIGNVPDSLRVDMQAFLAELHGDDIAEVEWLIDAENRPANTEVATLIRGAMDNVSREPLTADGEPVVGFWYLDIRIAESGADWDSGDILHLRAGIDENVVEIDGGANLPEGPIWVKDEALYRLVRTSMDTPDNTTIAAAAFAAYRDIVDIYLAQVPYASTIVESSRRELLGFYLAAEREDLGAKIYCINTVTVVEPAEKAPYLLAGGAYVDSQLRIHGDGESNLLVVVDEEPVGFVNWMWLELDRGLENCKSKEDLIRTAQNFGGVVQTQQELPLEPYTGERAEKEYGYTVGEETFSVRTGTEQPYIALPNGEVYRLPLPYADAELRYGALKNGSLDYNTKVYSYEAAAAYQVRAHDGSVLTQPGTYYYAVDLNTLTYTVRIVAVPAAEVDTPAPDPSLAAISALLGDWELDVDYTEAANGISLESQFGTALGLYGASLTVGSDRTIRYYIGVLSGEGTWQPDGDTWRYIATATLEPDGGEKRLTFYVFREGADSAKCLAMDYGSFVLYWTQEAVSEEEPARPGVTVVPDTTPFTDRPIEWTSPLNGMFERTYETQLAMLSNIDRTDPPFFVEQTLEFETCAVLLGKSLDTETGLSTGTAYILFRDGALGKLPLPEHSNGVALLPMPESVEKAQSVEQLYYDVLYPAFGYYSYTVDLDSRTVSMMHVAMPTEEDVHSALMAHHPVEIPEGAAYPYSAEGHYVWGYDFSYEEGYPICKLYAYVYFASFEWSNGQQKLIHPSYVMPVEMVFRGGAKDYWALIDFWAISSEDANYESSIRERIPDYFQDWPLGEIDSSILDGINSRLYESAAAYYATLPGLIGGGPAVVSGNKPFTDRPIAWNTPLNGMFERTYEAQLSMLGNIDRTDPPFFKEQVLEFEECAVVLGTSMISDGKTESGGTNWVSTGTAYILFRDGALGELPLPVDANGITVCPAYAERIDGSSLVYTVVVGGHSYTYTVNLSERTVSMAEGAAPDAERTPDGPPSEELIHAALSGENAESILERYGTGSDDADFITCGYVHLSQAWESGTTYTVYSDVLYMSYRLKGSEYACTDRARVPTKLTFTFADGAWKLSDLWTSDDRDSISAEFPSDAVRLLEDRTASAYGYTLSDGCDVDAVNYYKERFGITPSRIFTSADREFANAKQYVEQDSMTYEERLAWAKKTLEAPAVRRYVEGAGCIACVEASPDWGAMLQLRFADGTIATLGLPSDERYRASVPDSMKFENGKFVYEKTFDDELRSDNGTMLIHLKGTYHYEVDLNAKTVSLTVLPVSEEEADTYTQLLRQKNAIDDALWDYRNDPSQFTDGQAALLDSVTSFSISQKDRSVIVGISGLNAAKTNAFRELFGDSPAYVLTEGHQTTVTSTT